MTSEEMNDITQVVRELERLEAELAVFTEKEKEWAEAKQSAVEIIQYDETMSKQSPYWRSMLLSLVQGMALDREAIDEHVAFDIQHEGAEISNISMTPKTEKGMKLIQVWGVMDMLTDLVKGLGIQDKQEIKG